MDPGGIEPREEVQRSLCEGGLVRVDVSWVKGMAGNLSKDPETGASQAPTGTVRWTRREEVGKQNKVRLEVCMGAVGEWLHGHGRVHPVENRSYCQRFP